jgi:single-strand DNA-binding protein
VLPNVTGEFRVAQDPELRFTPSGVAICNMRVVASSRKQNENNEWVDDKTCWLTLTGFKQQAENMAESFQKGHLIMVDGRLETQEWEATDGTKRTSLVVLVNQVGHSTKWDASKSLKADRPQGSGSAQGGQQQGSGAPADDPWAVGPPGGGQNEEPPF